MKSIALLAACFLSSTAWAGGPLASGRAASTPQPPRFMEVLSAAGDFTIPAAWSGIWDFANTDYDCTTQVPSFRAETDTLCTGANLYPGELSCTGTVTDTDVDVDCSGTEEIIKGCSVTFSYSLTATRSGSSMSGTSSYSWYYTPTLCAFAPDQCVETVTTGTRVGAEPPDCLTAVEGISWGQVKATYR